MPQLVKFEVAKLQDVDTDKDGRASVVFAFSKMEPAAIEAVLQLFPMLENLIVKRKWPS